MALVKPPLLLAFSGNETLTEKVAARLGLEIGNMEFRRFPDEESYLRILSEIGTRPVFIFCGLSRPDPKMMPLLFLAKTARRLGASRVGLVAPYLAYMRQDTAFQPGEAVSAAYFADFLSGVFDGLVTVDPHLHRIPRLSEIYTIPYQVVSAVPAITNWIKNHIPKAVLIGPDSESQQWVQKVARKAGSPYLILKKKRLGDKEVEVSVPHLEDYPDHVPVIVDDIISTARTMIEAVSHLRKMGAPAPTCIGIHGVFSGNAFSDLQNSGAGKIITCNSISHPSNGIDLTDFLGEGIQELMKVWEERNP